MQYYSEDENNPLREAFEAQVLNWPDVTTRPMFGCPAYLADGKLFAFLVTKGIVITQVRKRDREELKALLPAEPFKAGEREITRWLQITLEDVGQLERIMRLVRRSYETVLQY
ncbi:MAG: TfoX/Sxy family protein [Anaerolineae bacterium]|nr:TfoX/Sxy family protein [Anaerolineae bacterium]